jgi:hypothetical protein
LGPGYVAGRHLPAGTQNNAPIIITYLGESRHVNTAGAAEVVDRDQLFEQSLGNDFRVESTLKHSIGTCERDDGQAVRLIFALDDGFQAIRIIRVAVGGDEDKALSLAGSPDHRV